MSTRVIGGKLTVNMKHQFEATANFDDWPANVPGKPTQAAVFGVLHPKKGICQQILWTGQFPDLEPAMYWAAKKEMAAVRKDKWMMASRVLWQHDLTPEQAVEMCVKKLEPQLKQVLNQITGGASGPQDIDLGEGPMRAIQPGEAKQYYVEVVPEGDDQADPIASFIGGPPSGPLPDDDEAIRDWVPNDPREE